MAMLSALAVNSAGHSFLAIRTTQAMPLVRHGSIDLEFEFNSILTAVGF
jgi:hypothetical protein